MLNMTDRDILRTLKSMGSDLDDGDQAILRLMLERGTALGALEITQGIAGIEGLTGTSRPQVNRRLGRLIRNGLITKTGAGRLTRYSPDESMIAKQFLTLDPGLRDTKIYNRDLLRHYMPNESRLMPIDLSQELKDISDSAIRVGSTLNEVASRRLMIDMAWSSSKMEGNTYTLGETQELIEAGVEPKGKSANDTQMIRNHVEAINFMVKNSHDLRTSIIEFRGLHAMLSHLLLSDPADEGGIRNQIIEIGKSAYKPEHNPHVLDESLRMIADKGVQIEDPFEQSMFLMLNISYLQPFIDVNKRTGRFAANIPLFRSGHCPLSFFGMDVDVYTSGIISFYETNSPTIMTQAYEQGYKASAERYRTYTHILMDGDDIEKKYSSLIKSTMRACVKAIIDRIITADDEDDYIRKRLDGVDKVTDRDAITLACRHALHNMDELKARAYGIPGSTYEAFDQTRHDEGHGPR